MALLGNTVGLIYEIKGDSSGAEKTLNAFSAAVDRDALKMSSSFGGAASAGGIFAGVLTTIVGAAAGTAAALFTLAQRASDAGSEIFDASQKTGLHAETLSSLKLAADESGSSLEQVSASVTKFSKLIGEAATGSKEAKDKLVQLGLDPQKALKDLDGSLAIVFKRIADAQNPIVATKLATDAFGKSGADLIPVIRSFDGDMAGLIRRAKELGLTLTDEDAAAADAFGDALGLLKVQAVSAANTFARQFMPEITNALKEVSRYVAQNQHLFKRWGEEVKNTFQKIREMANWMDTAQGQKWLLAIRQAVNFATGGVGVVMPTPPSPNGPIPEAPAENKPDVSLNDAQAIENAAKKREEEIRKRLAEFGALNSARLKSVREQTESANKQWKSQLDANIISFDEYKKNILANLDEFSRAAKGLLEQAFLIESSGKTGTALETARVEFATKMREFNDEIRRQRDELSTEEVQVNKKKSEELYQAVEERVSKEIALEKARASRQLAEKQAELDREEISQKQFEKNIAQIRLASLEFEKKKLMELRDAYGATDAQRADAKQKIAIIDEQLAQQTAENASAIIRAIKEEVAAYDELIKKIQEANQANTPPRPRVVGPPGGEPVEGSAEPRGTGIIGGILDGLGTSVENAQEPVSILTNLGNMLAQTFSQVASAVGSAVRAFVLFGSAGGGFRKFAAEVIASLAQMAVVQALFELAQGLAMSALAWFTGNPKYAKSAADHYLAAGVFGVIGGIAAVAGRAVAGDSFKQGSAEATGGGQSSSSSGNRSSGGAYSGQEDGTINASRNAPAGALANPTMTLRINDQSGWFSKMFKVEMERNTNGMRTFLEDAMAKA